MNILYATDGSEGALAAGRFLAGLPFGSNDYIHIVTVVDRDRKESLAKGERQLAAAQEALNGFPGRITTATETADSTSEVAETLLWAADYLGADLIAIGARGHSALAHFFLGSVAESLTRLVDIPVLLARTEGLPLREVVVGVDGSTYARDAACWATSMLPLPNTCTFRFVQAVQPPVWAAYPESMLIGVSSQTVEELSASSQQEKQQILAQFAAEISEGHSAAHRIEVETPVGNAAPELLRVIERDHAGLVVVGSRGMTGMKSFLLGSVSADIAHHAPCSVLVVKQHEEWKPASEHSEANRTLAAASA
jgi:nucleotide-binding universal stress UspA family protein